MVNDSTRGYSVYITDDKNTISGSGVLFYAGGDSMFVFTCAHVVEDLETIKVFILKEIDAKKDLYDVFCTDVPSKQIVYSPLDEVSEDVGGDKVHTEDLAIIRLGKPEHLEIETTDYFIAETLRNDSVYVQGFANGVPDGKNPISYLECLHGHVVVNPADDNKFTVRIDVPYLNQENRVSELEGLSGSPVWADNETENGLLGIFTSAYETNATLGKTFATKSRQIRSIMKERFGIVIERRLEGIDDDAGHEYKPIVFDSTILEDDKKDAEKWIEDELSALRLIIDDLKLQKAIDKGRELASDQRYNLLSIELKRRVKQYLLYCYEIADMDEEFEALEAEMCESGLLKDHDTLRQFTRSFMKKDYRKTIEAAQYCIATWDGTKKESLRSFAKLFLLMARAYTEDLPVKDTIETLLDEKENFILPLNETEDYSLAYQMIGYVYGNKYHDHVKSVRFLNRSYRIGFDNIILETLGAAYYFLAIQDAVDENDKVIIRKIDRKTLYKARELFLMIIGKADELFWSGTMRRVGVVIYNTFVFLQDNYRILTIYPDVVKYVNTPDDVDEFEFWRDLEMKQARIVTQSGAINVDDYSHLTRKDRILLETMAITNNCCNIVEKATAQLQPEQIQSIGLEAYIRNTIKETESNVRLIERRDRTHIYVQLMNMYGRGMTLFNWDKIDKLRYCVDRAKDSNDPELLDSLENYLFEFENPIEETIERYKQTFNRRKNLITWQELNHLYVRHGMLDKADEMYRTLLAERKELISDEPEYSYRAFIEYVTTYKRDLKYALQCYLDAKEAFRDTDISGFWELELMVYSNIFNEPERFEIERWPFVEKGLLTEEQYHRTAFIAYLTNLNEEKAKEHNEYIRSYPHIIHPITRMLILNQEEIHFLNWMGEIQPMFPAPPFSMTETWAQEAWKQYESEEWHKEIDKQTRNQFNVDRTIAIDAWSLYQLIENGKLDLLDKIDRVYVSHSSIIRLHEELSRTNNQKIRELQSYIREKENIHIWSGGFKSQIEVRNITEYTETASAVTIGVEKDCPVVLGEPNVEAELIEHFGKKVIRIKDLEKVCCVCE